MARIRNYLLIMVRSNPRSQKSEDDDLPHFRLRMSIALSEAVTVKVLYLDVCGIHFVCRQSVLVYKSPLSGADDTGNPLEGKAERRRLRWGDANQVSQGLDEVTLHQYIEAPLVSRVR
jgi:hypothetical protein